MSAERHKAVSFEWGASLREAAFDCGKQVHFYGLDTWTATRAPARHERPPAPGGTCRRRIRPEPDRV